MPGGTWKDLTNQKFHRLLVMNYIYKNGKMYWVCLCDCGNTTTVMTANLKNGNTKSCGCLRSELRVIINKTRVFSKETRKKISVGNKGRVVSEAIKRKTAETRARNGKNKGNGHYNYNPNLTDEERMDRRTFPEYKEWRKAVYVIDNYTCRKCGDNKGGNLNAHHIESYKSNPELRTEVSNGITLCETCHKDFHHQYGYSSTRAQLIEFLRRAQWQLANTV